MGKLSSFVFGGVIGAGIALFFAPRSGEETRALVAEKVDEYWGKGQSWYDQGRTRVQNSIAGAQPTINKKGDELREKIDNARNLIAEQVAKNAAAARDAINDKVPVATDKINQAADVVRGHIDNAASKIKERATNAAQEDGAGSAVEAAAAATTATPETTAATEPAATAADAIGNAAPEKVEPTQGIAIDPTVSTDSPLGVTADPEKAS